MTAAFYQQIQEQLSALHDEGLYKNERVITSPQQANIRVGQAHQVLNFCANNYLGLANHPNLIAAAKAGMDQSGFGMASVRFICGTQDQHKALESALSDFLGMEDTILYTSCFDANTGLFETLLDSQDAIISDALNHASIIDGVRLCKAMRFRYANNDMQDLKAQLEAAKAANARHILIVTDGVFLWMASLLICLPFAIWLMNSVHSSWWMTPTPSALWATTAAARMSTTRSWIASTSSPARSVKRWAAHPAATPQAKKK